ncbi:hypothetical protein MN202_05985 [Rheinheimera muenzenbergensis]|uniref:Uncharacterized protein n=1 Tax=Rheinheimera muenzenbergensis TaxID=1193628 RepID=A0ABU8C4E4_9GAMM
MTGRLKAIQPDWLGKTLAGIVLGLAIAFVCVGFYAWYGPGSISSADKSQFNMWLLMPLWFGILSLVFLFRSARQAWLVLGVVTALLYCSFFLLRRVV